MSSRAEAKNSLEIGCIVDPQSEFRKSIRALRSGSAI